MTDHRWVVTCDPGIDDAIALAVAAGRPDCEVRAVVAGGGNVDAATAWHNAAALVALFGLDVPVGLGSAVALDGSALGPDDDRGPAATSRQDGVPHGGPHGAVPHRGGPHGGSGAPGSGGHDTGTPGSGGHGGGTPGSGGHGTGRHGRDGLAGMADRLPEVVAVPADAIGLVGGQVIALGPLTDVVRALRAGRPLDRVVWMGGTIGWHVAAPDQLGPSRGPGTSIGSASPDQPGPSRRPGTSTGSASPGQPGPPRGPGTSTGPASPGEPPSEFNASADVVAVEEALAARLDLSIVPIDVTRQVTLDGAALDRWDAGPGGAQLCAALARARRRAGNPVLHDPVAVVAALEPDLFTWQLRPLRCSRGGAHPPGALVPDHDRGGPARVAVAVDAPAVRRRIVAAVLALPG
jgi:inosine-uridine nucleoside N-ribohydrolase